MKINYDEKANAIYIHISRGKVAKTIKVGKDFLVDLSEKGAIIGLEILQAGKNLGSQKDKLTVVVGNKPVLLTH